MQNTDIFNLKKPDLTDLIDVDDLNDNSDIIDNSLTIELCDIEQSDPDLPVSKYLPSEIDSMRDRTLTWQGFPVVVGDFDSDSDTIVISFTKPELDGTILLYYTNSVITIYDDGTGVVENTFDFVTAIELKQSKALVNSISGAGSNTNYPSTKAVVDYVAQHGGGGGSVPSGENIGDILVWDGTEWEAKPKWQMIYQQVEWIRNSGDSGYFTISYKPKGNTKVVIELSDLTAGDSSHMFVFGSRVAFQDRMYGLSYDNSSIYFPYGANQNSASFSGANNKHIYVTDSTGLSVDGTQVISLSAQTFESGVNLIIYGLNNNGSRMKNANFKLYKLEIYENDVKMLDIVPVYNVFTSEIGLFDKHGNIFYSNSGTGTFLKGADV